MKLDDFLNVVDENRLEVFIISKGLEKTELWEIIIYMNESIDINSEIEFLTVEQTDDQLVFHKENKKLFALFSIGNIIEELYETLQLNTFFNNKEKAQRLIEYAINDT